MIHIDKEADLISNFNGKDVKIINVIMPRKFKKASIFDILMLSSKINTTWYYNVFSLFVGYLIVGVGVVSGLYLPSSIFILLSILLASTFFLFKTNLIINFLLHGSIAAFLFSLSPMVGGISLGLFIISRIFIDIPMRNILNSFSDQYDLAADIFKLGKKRPLEKTNDLVKAIKHLKNEYEMEKSFISYAYFSGVYNSELSEDEEAVSKSFEFINSIY